MMVGKKLVVVSHTEHRKSEDCQIFGWGPTVEEINYLSCFFEEVIHVACFELGHRVPYSYRAYANKNIKFFPIPKFGGETIIRKLDILLKMPKIIKQIERALPGASHVQLRVPMGIGVFLIPYFSIRHRKFVLWVKYANNWGDPQPKVGFRLQRYMLEQNWANCKVTINGSWPSQESHCLSFENPCLYMDEILDLEKIHEFKTYYPPYNLLFVGRIEKEKGVGIILDWLSKMDLSKIGKVTLVGDGKDFDYFLNLADYLGLNSRVKFLGSKSREQIHLFYKEHHFFLFPSMASEGFPKVIAEAMAFGCIPVTSDISSLKEFLQHSGAGIDWKMFISQEIETIRVSKPMIKNGLKFAHKFTFENYIERLLTEIFI